MAIERRRVLIRGRVQGVGFRWFARDTGAAMGLRGIVRNLPDGRTVEAVVQGERDDIARFVEAVSKGPPGAFVSEVEQSVEPLADGEHGFVIVA
jgi:acylphosphatase